MLRNIEIKAKIADIAKFMEKAKSISDQPESILKQEDTYFRVANGRLKLRETQGAHAQLVFYNRPDVEGPKLSSYSKQMFENAVEANGLKEILKASLGVIGIVKKQRHLFMVGQTRVHVDNVDDLGHFMELEVVLNPEESVEYGQNISDKLMETLGVLKEDLLPVSYIDLLLNKK